MTSPNAAFTEMVTTTLRSTKRRISDNVTNHNGLLTWMKDKGNIKTDHEGGYEIQLPLSWANNATYSRFFGGDVQNIGASDVLTSAKYDWCEAAIHVTVNQRELNMNRSEERMINLVKARLDVAMASAANNMSVDIYSDGALTNQIGGLQTLITVDGTGTVGGINAATYTFWKNQFLDMSAPATYSALRNDMNTIWLRCVRGKDKPDLLVFTHDIYTTYENGLMDLQRYNDTTSSMAAKSGFETLKYKTASMIFDNNTNYGSTAERGYFLNTDHLYLIEHPEGRWAEQETKTPINQFVNITPMYWMGQMATDARFLQGLLFDS